MLHVLTIFSLFLFGAVDSKIIIYIIFSFFLERQMLEYFLSIMKQNCGSFICVQLLQTLNILFENIRHKTSLCKFAVFEIMKIRQSFFFLFML